MPWRLISFIVILGFVVIFAGFNINNSSDVSFGFTVVPDVPIFISLFFAFVVGVFVMIPFVVGRPRKKKELPTGRPPASDDPEVQAMLEDRSPRDHGK